MKTARITELNITNGFFSETAELKNEMKNLTQKYWEIKISNHISLSFFSQSAVFAMEVFENALTHMTKCKQMQ